MVFAVRGTLAAELLALAELGGVVTFNTAVAEVFDVKPGTPKWRAAYRRIYSAVYYLKENGELQSNRAGFWYPTLSGQPATGRSAITARIAREFWELHVLTGEKFAQLQRSLGIEPPRESDVERPAGFPVRRSEVD